MKVFNREVKVAGKKYIIAGLLHRVYQRNEAGHIFYAYGDSVPTDGTAGFAKGCFYIQGDGGVGTVLYLNEGSSSSCDFNVFSASGSVAYDDINAPDANKTLDFTTYTTTWASALTSGALLTLSGSGVYTGSGFFAITANSATTGVLAIITGNGLTTGTLLTLTSSGTITTTGEILSIVANSATTSTGVLRISATGLTDGWAMEVTGGGANITASGGLLNLVMGAATVGAGIAIATTGVYTGAGLVQLTANSATTGVILQITANGLTTGTGLSISSSGTLVTTGELLDIVGNSATTCTGLVRISGTGLTDGSAINVTGGGANMTASGNLLLLAMGAATVGNGIDLSTTGVYTGAGVVLITANSATTGDLLVISGTGLTTGSAILLTGGGANMTSGGQVLDVVMGAATVGQGVRIATSGVYTGTTGILDINATAATTGVIASIDGSGLTEGVGLEILATEATLTTGKYINCYDGAASDFSVAKYGATVIAGSAIGTASLTQTAGDHVLTSGNLILTAGHIKNTPQAIVNANTAISIVTLGTTIANNGASTHTLADGTVGQLKYIVCTVYTGDAVITPANFVGTTITLNAAGDSWLGVFVGTEWVTLALGGTAAVA